MAITVYMKPTCPYCVRAIALLRSKGADFEMIDISREPQRRAEMIDRAHRSTVPQIFINDRHLGGCDDLQDLDAAGQLDELLGSNADAQAT